MDVVVGDVAVAETVPLKLSARLPRTSKLPPTTSKIIMSISSNALPLK
jgi:hypothetical protein